MGLKIDGEEFGQLGSIGYFDMAALGIPPASVRKAVLTQFSEYMARGTSAREECRPDEIIRRAEASVRGFLGVSEGRSFVGSTAMAAADAVLQAMPSGRGSVVCYADDYPGLVTLAARCAARTGRDLRVVQSERWSASDLLALIDRETSVVLVSQVHWITGAVIDLTPLVAARHDFGFTLVVDASQAMPIVPTGGQIEEIDVLVSVAHKWFCGSPGAAVVHLSAQIVDRLGKTLDSDLWPVWPSNQSYTSMFALSEMIGWYGEYGLDRIRERTLAAAQMIRQAAMQHGWSLIAGSSDIQQSGIVTLSFPESQAPELSQRVRADGLYLSARGAGLRLSPHFTASREAIEKTVTTLSAAAQQLQT